MVQHWQVGTGGMVWVDTGELCTAGEIERTAGGDREAECNTMAILLHWNTQRSVLGWNFVVQILNLKAPLGILNEGAHKNLSAEYV